MKADVCMILEGSYPYVVGGVSTWIHDLVTSLSDVSFHLVHIGVGIESPRKMRYTLPPNVLQFQQIPLMESIPWRGPRFRQKRRSWEAVARFLEDLSRDDTSGFRDLLHALDPRSPEAITPYDVFHGKPFWNLLVQWYRQHFPDFSFLDYFWTLRFMALPLFRVLYAEVPPARLYHATCTGYAGLLGAVASIRTGAPLVLTEHGIYTNERMIEITQAQWIYRERTSSLVPTRQVGALQNLWMRKFEVLSRLSYAQATRIFTLYEGNRQMQIQGGAPPDRCEIIPNGIDLERYDAMHLARQEKLRGPPRVCMVGRVAPIKDVKTFIRAARMVHEEMPEVRFEVLGGTDEDESYLEECQRLVKVLSLKPVFDFPGAVDMKEHYPSISVLVLTSISEAQPFVLLEAMRVGIPVVATSVGACAELVLGSGSDDEALGPAGFITNVRSPRETADAILALLRDPEMARRMGETGRERVGRYYIRRKMLEEYRGVYRGLCGG
ncbi:MAG TPA: GT4 family glycosyltransferase PelF [Myxococcota bacterium]|nr:GT4 family glycosyltransferase PelF [Myxococcota bacterium]HQK49704.1 GT4 family glycosyltransferase PelF [Myxococcota bacterium]